MLTMAAVGTTKPGAESGKGPSGGSSRIEITSSQDPLQTRGQQRSSESACTMFAFGFV